MTIQEIQIVPKFVVEYEMEAKKARQAKINKQMGKDGKKPSKNGDDSDSDNEVDNNDVDLTKFESDYEDHNDVKVLDAQIDKLGAQLEEGLSEIGKKKQLEKIEKLKQDKESKKEQERQRKQWLQEQYTNYRSTCDQFIVPDSDLFTKLNIFGAYLFARQSSIKSAWNSYKKSLLQQYTQDLSSGKIKRDSYEELCWKHGLQSVVKEFHPSSIKKLENVLKIVQNYQNLPPKSRFGVDKKLDQWCKQHFVRTKGLSDCYKLFQQVRQIVATHLENKMNILLKGKSGDLSKSKSDNEQDSELGIEDITLGDQNDEEFGQSNPENQNDSKTNKNSKLSKTQLISALDPHNKAKYDRMRLLLDNLSIYTESIPPPSADLYGLLQQIILASFADKIAWKLSDEKKQEILQRSALQKSNSDKTSAQLFAQTGEPIRLIPRSKNYNEQSKARINILKQRFERLPDGLESLEYQTQLAEITAGIPLSMNDLTNAYEILESNEPIFISPDSIVYKKQHGFMNQMKEVRQNKNNIDNKDGSSNGNNNGITSQKQLSTQSLQQLAVERKIKSSMISQIQTEMDSELKFILFNEIVENQGKYQITFMNDCTLLNEKWLPIICNQLCHIRAYLNSPDPFMQDVDIDTHDIDNNNKSNQMSDDNNSSKQSKLQKAKLSTTLQQKSQSQLVQIKNPMTAELYRYSDVTYGHKQWQLKPYPVPYLPTVISTTSNSNGLLHEDLTQNTGTIQQYYQFFAMAILDGTLFPFLKPFVASYTINPSCCIETGKLREQVNQFINCLQYFNVYTVQDLYDIWYGTGSNQNKSGKNIKAQPNFLKNEFFAFITNKQQRTLFEKSWPPAK
jgi:hypothetical protein